MKCINYSFYQLYKQVFFLFLKIRQTGVAHVQTFGILTGRPICYTSLPTKFVQQPHAGLTRAPSISQPGVHPSFLEKPLSSGHFSAGYCLLGTSEFLGYTNSTVSGNNYVTGNGSDGNVPYLQQNTLALPHNCKNVTIGGPWRKQSSNSAQVKERLALLSALT